MQDTGDMLTVVLCVQADTNGVLTMCLCTGRMQDTGDVLIIVLCVQAGRKTQVMC